MLAECAAADDATDELAGHSTQAGIEDALIADDTASRERLWTLREGHSEAINAQGTPHKLDVGVPLHALAEFVTRVSEEIERDARPAGDPVRSSRRRQRPRQRAWRGT